MKYIRQILIIMAISLIGELLHQLLPLPVPASIYGIVILFTGLETRLIPLSSVKETGKFLLEIMPIMFIPGAVGLIENWGLISAGWYYYVTIIVVTTVLVMGVSGRVTQAMMRRKKHD